MFEKQIEQAENILSLVAPRYALKRAHARQMLAAYEATKHGRTRKMKSEHRGPDIVANESTESLRAQARFYDENYDIVTGALDTLAMRVAGPRGLMVEPMVKTIDGDLHDEFNRELNELFNRYWIEPDVSGELTGAMVEQLSARTWLRDGEMFAQIIEGQRAGLKSRTGVPFWIELMEPDFCPVNYDNKGLRIHQGAEQNSWGRPIRYYVYREHPGDYKWRLPSYEDLKPISGENILHLKMIKRIGQTRGVSLLHSVITRIEDLKDYEESERVAARIAAAMAFFIKKGSPDSFMPESDDDAEERSFKIQPGMVFDRLQAGEDVGTIQSNRPSVLLEPFRNAMVKAFASGMRLSYSSASKDYNGTYSAQRQELVEQWDHYETLQKHFADRFKRPIYERFVRMAVLSGKIKVPKEVDKSTLARAHFQGPAMPWIDPDKESKANERNNKAGYKTRSAIIRSRNENPIEVEEQLARERRREQELGLILTSNAEHELKQNEVKGDAREDEQAEPEQQEEQEEQ